MASVVSFSNYKFNIQIVMLENKLRLNNYLFDKQNNQIFKVQFSDLIAMQNGEIDYYFQLKITKELLLSIKNSFVANTNKICITAPYGFELHFDKYGNDYVLSVYCSTGVFVPQKCSYLDELQNLWISLFGEELIFSTEP